MAIEAAGKVADRMNIVAIVHWYPPINSSGAKRWEFTSKYLARAGHNVTVITTRKTGADGEFSEDIPHGVNVVELDAFGRHAPSEQGEIKFTAMYDDKPSIGRRIKTFVQRMSGQLPDPRLPFALSFAGPFLDRDAQTALKNADVVIGSCPPWTMLLAASLAARRYRTRLILDYRDQFSDNYEMPGSSLAKAVERAVDRWLCKRATRLVAISDPMAEYYSRLNPKTTMIMNGYDHESFEKAATLGKWAPKDGMAPIVLRYMGLVTPRCIPVAFLDALRTLKSQKPDRYARLNFEYYGSYGAMRAALIADYPDLLDRFSFFEAVPYQQSLKLMLEADYLLFSDTSDTSHFSSRGVLTTKLFEYIASGRPIIADIRRDTLAGTLIAEASDQHVISTESSEFEALLLSDAFLSPAPSQPSPIADRLSRKYAADQYMALMQDMVAKSG